VIRDVEAMSWAAHLATTVSNALGALDCDVLEDVLGTGERANEYVNGALHAVTNSFGERVGKDPAARQFSDEIRRALHAEHLRGLHHEVSSLGCIARRSALRQLTGLSGLPPPPAARRPHARIPWHS
jgi:hypothetical protein